MKNEDFIDRMEATLSHIEHTEKRERKRHKALAERIRRELTLFCDDLRARGIDPMSAKGKAILIAYVASGGAEGIARDARPQEEVW